MSTIFLLAGVVLAGMIIAGAIQVQSNQLRLAAVVLAVLVLFTFFTLASFRYRRRKLDGCGDEEHRVQVAAAG